MSMKTVTFLPLSGTVPQDGSRTPLFERVRTRVRDMCLAQVERARERRLARKTAATLEHLGPHELRDIGLVRLSGVHPTRYLRIYDFR